MRVFLKLSALAARIGIWPKCYGSLLALTWAGAFLVSSVGFQMLDGLQDRLTAAFFRASWLTGWMGVGLFFVLRPLHQRFKTNQQKLETQERLLQALVEPASEGIQILTPDGTRLLMNRTRIKAPGTDTPKERSSQLLVGIAKEDRSQVLTWFARACAGQLGKLSITLYDPKGNRRPVETRAAPLFDDHDQTCTILTLSRNLSEHHKTRQALEKTTRLYRLLSEVNQLIVRRPGQKALLERACQIAIKEGGLQLACIYLLEDGQLKPAAWTQATADVNLGFREVAPLEPLMQHVLNQEEAVICNEANKIPESTGLERFGLKAVCLLPLKVHDQLCGVFKLCAGERGIFDHEYVKLLKELTQDLGFALEVEIAEIDRRRSYLELEFLAYRDPLTKLPNRRSFLEHLTRAIRHAHRHGTRFALLLLDLDCFKDVNDSFGHSAGDRLLIQAATCFQSRLRATDLLARLGGDEFALILNDLHTPEDAGRVAADLIQFPPWHLTEETEVKMAVSCGIALFPDHGQDPEELLQHADAALYQAKAQGRGQFCYFNPILTERTRKRLHTASQLRRALKEKQLEIYFQPQVKAGGEVVGAEALVRWHHPERKMIPPAEFIPIAEQTGLIAELDLLVLKEVCRQGSAWLEAGLSVPTLAANLSPREFQRRKLDQAVTTILQETGFPADLLELELTETALMEHEQEAATILKHLRDLGVRLALDDFGTGYSSLSQLKRLPIDLIKIDKCFVDDLPGLKEDCEIATAIIAMSHALGIKVLAEGVETEAQFHFLAERGCDLYQGYLYSPPLPAETFAEHWLRNDTLRPFTPPLGERMPHRLP